jgi:hypothetical protein
LDLGEPYGVALVVGADGDVEGALDWERPEFRVLAEAAEVLGEHESADVRKHAHVRELAGR